MESCEKSGISCFKPEDKAPDFSAPAYYHGREIQVRLSDFRNKWLLLFFYSSNFTFV